jgi:uncharacterized membrane protein YfcA
MVPLQIMSGRVRPHNASANSLAAIVPISLVGGLIYYFGSRRPEVDLGFAGLMAIGSVVGAFVGARFAHRVPERQLLYVVAILLAAVGVKELISP